MGIADEVTDFVRDYFESPKTVLTMETDIAVIFGDPDPDYFGEFLEDAAKRFNIKHRELKDVMPGANTRPRGVPQFIRDFFFQKIDMEVICVNHLTVDELCQIVQAGMWPERFIMPSSQVSPR